MRVVINACYGGFGLSPEGEKAYLARKGQEAFFYVNSRKPDGSIDFDSHERADFSKTNVVVYTLTEDLGDNPSNEQMNDSKAWFSDRDVPRDDPDLIAVVEEMGREANGNHASLEIIDIPDNVAWVVEEYDGLEHIAEAHRTW